MANPFQVIKSLYLWPIFRRFKLLLSFLTVEEERKGSLDQSLTLRGGENERPEKYIYIYIYIPYGMYSPPLRNRWLRIQHSSVNDIELTLSSDFFFFQLET